jgi:hypothetical protein
MSSPSFQITSDWIRRLLLCGALSAGAFRSIDTVLAQDFTATQPLTTTALPLSTAPPPTVAQLPYSSQAKQTVPTTTGTPFEPPINPPGVAAPFGGSGVLSLGQWVLTPSLGLYTLYDSNLYSSPIAVRGSGFHIHPALSADYNTGIYDTQVYGNIDSTIYPTLDDQNNTFNRQAGLIQNYSPLPGLVFTAQGDYTHNTSAAVQPNSLPTPISSAGQPPPSGTAGVVGAGQQTVVNPNDVYTAQATIYKEFNRAFIRLNGLVQTTQFEQQTSQSYDTKTYNGIGGFWFTPQLYAFGDGIQSFTNPEVGLPSNSFRARGGIGSDRIGLFQGFVYYGQQGTEVNGGGTAGGDIYGGAVSYFPRSDWNMSFGVDRLRNISEITAGSPQSLGGVQFIPVGVSPTQSLQITTLTFKSNYTFTPQTSAYLVASYSMADQINGPPLETISWFTDFGVQHQLWQNLSLTLDYQYTSFGSPRPQTSFTRNLVSVGALYNF